MNRSENGTMWDETNPAVSVIMPVYNGVEYITKALDSARGQAFGDYEVIVINDGSPATDAPERKLRPYREMVTYLKQENRGPSAARNTGILAARGEFVAFL